MESISEKRHGISAVFDQHVQYQQLHDKGSVNITNIKAYSTTKG
jgi:hypothetical protein